MKKDTKQTQESQLQVQEPTAIDKPATDTRFAQEAAKFLVDIIKKNKWSKKLGGQSEHIMYEGWQTAGKFYGYTVKTFNADYIEYGGTWGFKAKAIVVNENTGVEVGGAEALCMSDEANWKSKPKFQLASMAQTRAGSKALRQILGFVVALAGYSPTPAEEMDNVSNSAVGGRADMAERVVARTSRQVDDTNMDILDRVCAVCEAVLPENVYLYSVNHYRKPLCFTHQKQAKDDLQAEGESHRDVS